MVDGYDGAMLLRGVCALVAAIGLGLGGCLDDPGVTCADGTLCPEGTACRAIAGTTHCVSPGQAAACAGAGDGGACTLTGGGTGVCNQGVCLRPGCGDGFLSAGEKCDGALLGDETCAGRGYYRGTLGCTADCDFDTSACEGTCGDGVLDAADGEECDLTALGDADCTDGGYYAAAGLRCSPRCRLDFGGCTGGHCGDGIVQGGELCDGAVDHDHDDCTDPAFGYRGGGAVGCNSLCQYDTLACTGGRCGDGAKNGDEECDGGDLGNASCMSLGYYGGNLDCTSTCFYNLDECHRSGTCGDGILQVGPEECDAGPTGGFEGDFGGQSCTTASLFDVTPGDFTGVPRYHGMLGCTPDCQVDTAGVYSPMACTEYCGDGILNGPEPCDRGALGMPDETSDDRYQGSATCRSFGYQFGSLMCVADCTRIDLAQCSGRCGDGVLQGDEACDGAVHAVLESSCASVGEHGALGCDSYCQVDASPCEATTWGAVQVAWAGPPVSTVHAMWAAGPHDVWAIVDASRTLIHGDGERWGAATGVPLTPQALAGAGTRVWIGDATGAVAEQSGGTWTALGRPASGPVVALWGDASRLFAAVQRAGAIELWRWNGTTWSAEPLPQALTGLIALRGLPGGNVYVLGTSGTTTYLEELAASWTAAAVPGGFYRGLYVVSPELLWIYGGTSATVGQGQNVIQQRVRGAWVATPLLETTVIGAQPVPGTLIGAGGDPDNLWFAGTDNGRAWLAASTGNPATPTTRVVGPYPPFAGLADSGRGDLWAWGAGGLVAHRDGAGWVAPYVPGSATDTATVLGRMTGQGVTSVAVTSGDVYLTVPSAPAAATPLYLVRHRADQPFGVTPDARWETPLPGVATDLVLARTDGDVWAFARGAGQLWRGSGTAWTNDTANLPFAVSASSVRAAAAIGGAVYVAAASTRVVRIWTATGGWTTTPAWPDSFDPVAITATGPTDVWVAGAASRVDHWNGTAWQSLTTPVGDVRALYAASSDDVWAVASVNDGSRLVGTLLHKGPRDPGFVAVTGLPAIPSTLNAMWGTGASDLWVVGELGTLLHYDGLQWVTVTPAAGPTQRALFAIHGASHDRVWAVGGAGAVLRMSAALPPVASPPCADAIPLYCSGIGHALYGTVPAGGRVVYRFQTPFEATVEATVSSGVTAAVYPAAADGSCAVTGAAVTLPAVLAGHASYDLVLTGPAAATGYQLDFTCTATPL